MLPDTWKPRALASALICMFFCASSYAQTLFSEIHTIAAPDQAVPAEHNFTVSDAGTYRVTLTDQGFAPDGAATPTPSPLAAVKLAVTSGSALVGTTLTAPGSMQFSAAAGTSYVIHITGRLGGPGSGPIGIDVTNVTTSAQLATFGDTLALPSTVLPNNEGKLDDTFTVASDGSYVVTLTDLKLPQPLTTLTLVVLTDHGVAVTNPPLAMPGSATVSLQHGVNYRIFAGALADATVNAGLFSATVTPAGGGAPVYSKIVPVGTVAPVDNVALTGGTSYTLKLADLSFPTALTSLQAIVAANGQVAAQLTAPGTSPSFTAVSATYQVFALASTAATGSYTVTLAPQSGPPALSLAQAVSASGGTVPVAYTFKTTIATAGSYRVQLSDFLFPATLQSLNLVAVQGGAVLGTPLTTSGNLDINAASGSLSLLAFAQPQSATTLTGSGLFGISIVPGTSGDPIYEITQTVGEIFAARKVSIPTPGNYTVTVADVGFPAKFGGFAVIATRGTTAVGSIFGGSFINFPVTTPGNYFINFIAQPAGDDKAGTYAMSVGPSPPAPAVTFAADATQIAMGGTTKLTWSAQNATTCTASGAWSGARDLSNSEMTAALNATSTFTLTCDGPGGSTPKSVTITVLSPSQSGGGGGEVGLDLLTGLAGILLWRNHLRRRPGGGRSRG
ncbi:MAG TPA: hypothetical protein VGO18_20725 [Steroidobacteraceae bacterium]|jgi:hypothetical protein|nr:hypothetical protein [Steroidobacteraceae bacterium]